MKKRLFIVAVMMLMSSVTVLAQEKKFAVYGIGFYNLENLFDTCHDAGKNDYEYLPDGRNKWSGLKYAHKLRNMARVLAPTNCPPWAVQPSASARSRMPSA